MPFKRIQEFANCHFNGHPININDEVHYEELNNSVVCKRHYIEMQRNQRPIPIKNLTGLRTGEGLIHLPAKPKLPTDKQWVSRLGMTDTTSYKQGHKNYQKLARKWHPDRSGGDSVKMTQLNLDWEAAKTWLKDNGYGSGDGSSE